MTQNETNETGLAIRPADVLPVLRDPRGILTAAEVKLQAGQLQQLMEAVMVPGVHYGTVDGKAPESRTLSRTHQEGSRKAETLMLYQAGAEKLLLATGLRPKFDAPQVEAERSQHGGFLDITVRCWLVHVGTGTVVGEALGNCNSRERRYKNRTVYPDKATKWEREAGELEERTGRNGSTYSVLVVPVDPWEIKQTLISQAQKRAMVRATRTALAAGDLLGVDEDQAAHLRDFAEAQVVEVELATEDKAAASDLRARARAAVAPASSPKPASDRAVAAAKAAEPPALTSEQAELAALQVEASALSKRLSKVEDYTAADYKQLVRSASGGRTHEPQKLDAPELRAFIAAAGLVLAERGGEVAA